MESSNSLLILIDDASTTLSFDPVEIDKRLPSISFLIRLLRIANPQSCVIEHRCWFDHDSLNRFESDLSQLLERHNGCVCLADLSEHPKLEFERNGDDVFLRFHALETNDQANVVFTISYSLDDVRDVLRRLQDYPKWW